MPECEAQHYKVPEDNPSAQIVSEQDTAQHSMLLMAEHMGKSLSLRVNHSCVQNQCAPDRRLLDGVLCGVEDVRGALHRVSVEH